MQRGGKLLRVALSLLIAALLATAACTKAQDNKKKSEVVTIPIKVTTDQIYNFALAEEIGEVKFRNADGAIGSRVDGICFLETLSRFPDQRINVKLELLNQDAAQAPWTPVEWVQDTNEVAFSIIIPLVETVPAILNFQLRVYQYEYNEETQRLDDDTVDDDTTDDDTVDDDTADDDTVDDDTADDDTVVDDDISPTPDRVFEADAVYLFTVNKGQPGAGD